jgi:hypothetical protein
MGDTTVVLISPDQWLHVIGKVTSRSWPTFDYIGKNKWRLSWDAFDGVNHKAKGPDVATISGVDTSPAENQEDTAPIKWDKDKGTYSYTAPDHDHDNIIDYTGEFVREFEVMQAGVKTKFRLEVGDILPRTSDEYDFDTDPPFSEHPFQP